MLRDRDGFLADARRKFLRRQDARVFAPAQDPALDFLQATELQFQNDRAVGLFPDALGFMPFSFGDQPRREWVELQTNPLLLAGRVHPEASAEDLRDRKIGGAAKTFGR